MNRLELMRNASAFVFLASAAGMETAAVEASDCIMDLTAPISCEGGSPEGCEINCHAEAMQNCANACLNECNTSFTNYYTGPGCSYHEGEGYLGEFQCICFETS